MGIFNKISVFKTLSAGCRSYTEKNLTKGTKCAPKPKKTPVGATKAGSDKKEGRTCEKKKICKDKEDTDCEKPIHSKATTFRNISLGLVAFILCLSGLIFTNIEHHERAPFVRYEYLRIRNKPYFFSDGKRTLFHNSKINPLPEGYEDELEKEAEGEGEEKEEGGEAGSEGKKA